MLKERSAASSLLARTMSKAKSGGAGGEPAPRTAKSKQAPGEAFDVWLQQGLHKLYDSVANEPIPEELLKLIEQDLDNRTKS